MNMDKFMKSVLCSFILLISLSCSSFAQTCNNYRFESNQVFGDCSDLPVLSSYLHWTFHPSNNTADIAFRKTGTSNANWVAWGLNPTGQRMAGTQALVAYHVANGTLVSYMSQVTNSPDMSASELSFPVSNLRAEYSSGEMRIFATLQLTSSLVSTNQVWQEGPATGGTPGIHSLTGDSRASVGSINFQTGAVTAGSDTTTRKRNRHGVLNAISWGILMPLGAMIARYVKVFKVANPAWFYLHISCQVSAYIIGVAGWATGIKLGNDSPAVTHDLHRTLGIILFTFGTIQMFALLLRPKPDHKYRLYWNIYHHSIGYATIIMSIINIYEGFDILQPEKKWKRIYSGILIFLGANVVFLEAVTWFIVLKRRRSASSNNKHVNGVNV